ncbi:MAG TPA: hypothetical protein VFV02_09025, partial [Acidimicrobiales bacterium]|nr:hypothetical protein [Acidimicrobiales bacterium]
MSGTAPVTVCCPTCWTWSQLKNSTSCKRCGTPFVLPDGRRLDQVQDSSGGPAPPAFANAPTVALGIPTVEGVNWILIARWITIVYGTLTV